MTGFSNIHRWIYDFLKQFLNFILLKRMGYFEEVLGIRDASHPRFYEENVFYFVRI